MDDIKKNKEETECYHNYVIAYKKAMKVRQSKLNKFFEDNPDIYDILSKNEFQHPDEINQPKYLALPVNIIVLDDLMATGALINTY